MNPYDAHTDNNYAVSGKRDKKRGAVSTRSEAVEPFIHIPPRSRRTGHPLATALVMSALERVGVGRYWGFESRREEKPVMLVRRVSEVEFAVAVLGAGREMRLDLVNTAQTASDTLASLNPSVKIRFIP